MGQLKQEALRTQPQLALRHLQLYNDPLRQHKQLLALGKVLCHQPEPFAYHLPK